jgi:hypothetical protein
MTDERITWPIAAKDAREAALEAWQGGDDRDAEDIAHEYADGCADVIYNYRALSLYMDSTTVSDYLDFAIDIVHPSERTPERIASVCAYLATRCEYAETLRGLREDAAEDDADERMRERVQYGNAWAALR